MDIRVTLAATGPVPESLLALIPAPISKTVDQTAYGQRINLYTHHDDPAALRRALRAVAGNVAVGVLTRPLAAQPARLLMMDVDSTLTTTEAGLGWLKTHNAI